MSIFDHINNFWFRNESEPCSPSEMALFFYLLFEANRQHWVMPFKVSTQMIQARLNTSKQNVMKAREGLAKRGFISFFKSEGKGKPALYTLLLSTPDEDTGQLLPLTQELSQELLQGLSQPLSVGLTRPLPLSNIKEEDKRCEEDTGIPTSPHSSCSNDLLTLSELRERFLQDEPWLLALSERLSGVGIPVSVDALKEKITEFFKEQQARGVTGKKESDCREHVFNWIKYHYKNYKNYGQETRRDGKTGRIEISANRPEDYTGHC